MISCISALNAAERRGQPWTILVIERRIRTGPEVIVADPNVAPMYARVPLFARAGRAVPRQDGGVNPSRQLTITTITKKITPPTPYAAIAAQNTLQNAAPT